MAWQKEFETRILERGYNYYKQGKVLQLITGESSVVAVVSGSGDYNVTLEIKNNELHRMDCDCPYANSGSNCKHMAAAIFEYEEISDQPIVSSLMEIYERSIVENALIKENLIKDLLKIADKEVIDDFFIRSLISNEALFESFKHIYICDLKPIDMISLKFEVNNIFWTNSENGFIDYYSADNFFGQINYFMQNEISEMIKRRNFKEAFELLNYIFLKMDQTEIDDSAGGLGLFMTDCTRLWEEILWASDDEFKMEMFRWFKNQLFTDLVDYLASDIEDFLYKHFLEENYLILKLELSKQMLDSFEKTSNPFYNSITDGKWALRYIEILQQLNVSDDTIVNYIESFLGFSDVRIYYIEYLIADEDFDKAIIILKEGKDVDKKFPGLIVHYSLMLKDLYKEVGNDQAYREELFLLISLYKPGDLDLYKELKSLYPKDIWTQKREIIFDQLLGHLSLEKLYIEEKLLDRLLNILMNTNQIWKLYEYEHHLKKLYPQQLLGKYEEFVEIMAIEPHGRSHYREIVGVLKKMQKYPNGNEKVNTLVNQFRILYKNRPAMMDELNQL